MFLALIASMLVAVLTLRAKNATLAGQTSSVSP
jgi:hypothetical protein